MVHTVNLNNEFEVKELSKKTSRERANLNNHHDKYVESGRYMSSIDFKKRALEKVNKFCDKHGIL